VSSYSALPEPMLARTGRLPASGDYSYEVKWDGFRATVSTESGLRVRSRRGWDMTPQLGFLGGLPARAVLDGELVALDGDGKPDFPLICACLLQHRYRVPLTFMVFDMLRVDGQDITGRPYQQSSLGTKCAISEKKRLPPVATAATRNASQSS
jgi:bifunctional non-homologous end joining protein LigD